MRSIMVENPKNLPTENLESILLDKAGSTKRLIAVAREYRNRSDKSIAALKVIQFPWASA